MEFLENCLSKDHEILQLIENDRPHKSAVYDSPAASGRQTAKNAACDGFVCIKFNAVSKVSSNSWMKNIGIVFELRGVLAFRLAQPYGGLLVTIILHSL